MKTTGLEKAIGFATTAGAGASMGTIPAPRQGRRINQFRDKSKNSRPLPQGFSILSPLGIRRAIR